MSTARQRSAMVAALAEVLDFSAPISDQFGSFGELADALMSQLRADAPGEPVAATDELRWVSAKASLARFRARGVTPDVAALAASAGEALGAKRTDYWGNPPRAVDAPEGSAKVRRVRQWERERAAS